MIWRAETKEGKSVWLRTIAQKRTYPMAPKSIHTL